MKTRLTLILLLHSLPSIASATGSLPPKDKPAPQIPACKTQPSPYQSPQKSSIYKSTPFKQGEVASYKVHYMGILVGYGYVQVLAPVEYENEWLQHFSTNANTGDWYSAFFVARDKAMAYTRPDSFAVRKFYLKQDEGKMFGDRLIQEKWLNFHQEKCYVDEIVQKKDGEPDREYQELVPGAMDALGAVFKLRTVYYKPGENQKFLVYSSGKNWWLEVIPLKTETIEVPAGSFSAIKLKLQTYLGKELQQKGDVHIWIAQEHPSKPLIKIEGEIKIGSVVMELNEFKAGKNE